MQFRCTVSDTQYISRSCGLAFSQASLGFERSVFLSSCFRLSAVRLSLHSDRHVLLLALRPLVQCPLPVVDPLASSSALRALVVGAVGLAFREILNALLGHLEGARFGAQVVVDLSICLCFRDRVFPAGL